MVDRVLERIVLQVEWSRFIKTFSGRHVDNRATKFSIGPGAVSTVHFPFSIISRILGFSNSMSNLRRAML